MQLASRMPGCPENPILLNSEHSLDRNMSYKVKSLKGGYRGAYIYIYIGGLAANYVLFLNSRKQVSLVCRGPPAGLHNQGLRNSSGWVSKGQAQNTLQLCSAALRNSRFISLQSYLSPKSMQHNSPKPLIISIAAIVLHTFGVQEIAAWCGHPACACCVRILSNKL